MEVKDTKGTEQCLNSKVTSGAKGKAYTGLSKGTRQIISGAIPHQTSQLSLSENTHLQFHLSNHSFFPVLEELVQTCWYQPFHSVEKGK